MILKPHPDYSTVLRRVINCSSLAHSFSTIVYRSTSLRYARSSDILSGEGSRKAGGRWNGIGTFPTVYASDSPETAMAESLAYHRFYSIPVHNALPRIFVAIKIDLQSVLDIRSGRVRRVLGISRERMLSTNWRNEQQSGMEAITQAIGRACYEAGLEGAIVPSSAGQSGFNIIVFPELLQAESSISVEQADQLPLSI